MRWQYRQCEAYKERFNERKVKTYSVKLMANFSKRNSNLKCDFCGREKDTLYFHGKKQICEDCRNKLRQESNGHIG
jgi:hypothetical protein